MKRILLVLSFLAVLCGEISLSAWARNYPECCRPHKVGKRCCRSQLIGQPRWTCCRTGWNDKRSKNVCCPQWRCCEPKPACCPQEVPVCEEQSCVTTSEPVSYGCPVYSNGYEYPSHEEAVV